MPSQVLTDLNLFSRLGSEGQESIIKVSISVESDAGEGSYIPTVVLPIDLQLANVVPQHERGVLFFSGKALQEKYCTASFRCISMCLNHQVRDASETVEPLLRLPLFILWKSPPEKV